MYLLCVLWQTSAFNFSAETKKQFLADLLTGMDAQVMSTMHLEI